MGTSRIFLVLNNLKIVYVVVIGDVELESPITEDYSIKNVLRCIVFNMESQWDRIYDDSIDSFSGIRMSTGKYAYDISTEFGGRNQANGKINFGICITKRMKAIIH